MAGPDRPATGTGATPGWAGRDHVARSARRVGVQSFSIRTNDDLDDTQKHFCPLKKTRRSQENSSPAPSTPGSTTTSPTSSRPASPANGAFGRRVGCQTGRTGHAAIPVFRILDKRGRPARFLRNGQNLYIVQQGERVKEDVEIKLLTPTAVVLSKHVKEAGRTVDATLPLTQDEQDAL